VQVAPNEKSKRADGKGHRHESGTSAAAADVPAAASLRRLLALIFKPAQLAPVYPSA